MGASCAYVEAGLGRTRRSTVSTASRDTRQHSIIRLLPPVSAISLPPVLPPLYFFYSYSLVCFSLLARSPLESFSRHMHTITRDSRTEPPLIFPTLSVYSPSCSQHAQDTQTKIITLHMKHPRARQSSFGSRRSLGINAHAHAYQALVTLAYARFAIQ